MTKKILTWDTALSSSAVVPLHQLSPTELKELEDFLTEVKEYDPMTAKPQSHHLKVRLDKPLSQAMIDEYLKDEAMAKVPVSSPSVVAYFNTAFNNIKNEITLPGTWAGMSELSFHAATMLKPGEVAKTTHSFWRGSAEVESKIIAVATHVGVLMIFDLYQRGSDSRDNHTVIQLQIPEGIYPLLMHRIKLPLREEDLLWMVDPNFPEINNIGHYLAVFAKNIL